MLKVEGLGVSFGERPVLADVSFELKKGEVIALLGPNGSGKSSLIKAVSGWLHPSRGSVFIGDKPLDRLTPRQKALYIGVMIQTIPEVSYLSVREIVMMGRLPYFMEKGKPLPGDAEKVRQVMEKIGIGHLASRYFSTLSGGEKQRVVLAKTLVQETPFYLLDEPLGSMDLHFQWETMSLLSEYSRSQRAAILISLHDLNLAKVFVDKVIFLHNGHIVSQGKTAEVLTPSFLTSVYGLNIHEFCYEGKTWLGVVKEKS